MFYTNNVHKPLNRMKNEDIEIVRERSDFQQYIILDENGSKDFQSRIFDMRL